MEDARAGERGGWNQGPFCREMWARPPGRSCQWGEGGVSSSHRAPGKAQSGPSDHQGATQGNSSHGFREARLSAKGQPLVCERPEGALPVKGENQMLKMQALESVQAGKREA